jgi:hypothetical protein
LRNAGWCCGNQILAAVFQAADILGFEVFFGTEGSMTDWKSIMQLNERPK